MNNLYLIGYRGVGKSSIAPMLARKCGWTVVEMDDRIEQKEQTTIADIFAEQGEEGFRNLETQMLREVAMSSKQVISTGGGIVLREDNRYLMRETGIVVWLQASAETIFNRLNHHSSRQRSKRPALTTLPIQDEITTLMNERSVLYATTSHFSVNTESHKLNEIVGIILTQLNWWV
ncbi:MAG TPA: shikimate kinase [Gemmatales bacterium]|nr:shikimate kinase [Gemmatales bacterium]